MRLNAGAGTFKFDGLLGDVQRVDHRDQNVLASVLVQLAAVLHDLNQLRLLLELIEQKDAAIFRQL